MTQPTEQRLEKQRRLYRRLRQLAAVGLPCPGNAALAFDIGYTCAESVGRPMTALVDEGLILREMHGNERIITIVETGAQTADPRVREPIVVQPKRPVRTIADIVINKAGLCSKDVLGRSRFREHVRVRQMIHVLSLRERWSLKHIARILNVDHTTVLHSRDALPRYAALEPETARLLGELTASLPPLPEVTIA